MMPYIHEHYGNPSSSHVLGRTAKQAVEAARTQAASLLHAMPDEVIFTSGGSESNNMVIKGVAWKYRSKGNHIITSTIEHPSVLNVCGYLEQNGYRITYLPVDHYGRVSPADLESAITDQALLVSIMHADFCKFMANPKRIEILFCWGSRKYVWMKSTGKWTSKSPISPSI